MLKVARFYFATSTLAWSFLRECGKHEISTGYPSLRTLKNGKYEVQVCLQDAELCKSIATAVRRAR